MKEFLYVCMFVCVDDLRNCGTVFDKIFFRMNQWSVVWRFCCGGKGWMEVVELRIVTLV